MSPFNSFVELLCLVFVVLAGVLLVGEIRLSQHFAQNLDFRKFQRCFFVGYLPCLFADSLQAPYLYYLYQSYGFLESQIAVIYIAGLVSGLFCSLFGDAILAGRFGPRLLTLAMIGISCCGCLLKLFPNYGVLMISRLLDGAASWLLSTAPFAWYHHHHTQSLELPPSWLGRTARYAALAAGILSVLAGFVAELSEDAFRLTPFPFVAAVPVMLLGAVWIVHSWEETSPEAPQAVATGAGPGRSDRPPLATQYRYALRTLRAQPSLILLASVQALFESVLYTFVFLWTPIFMTVKPIVGVRPVLGVMYASFMASALAGTILFKFLSRRVTAWYLLPLSVLFCFVNFAVVVMVMYPTSNEIAQNHEVLWKYKLLFVAFCLYELGVGLYFPVMERLQKEMLLKEERSVVLAIFRIPLNMIACAGLWGLHSREGLWGNWLLLAICMIVLLFAFLSALLLQAVSRTAVPDVPRMGGINAPADDGDEG